MALKSRGQLATTTGRSFNLSIPFADHEYYVEQDVLDEVRFYPLKLVQYFLCFLHTLYVHSWHTALHFSIFYFVCLRCTKELIDHLYAFLAERGVDERFAGELVRFSSSHEHQLYVQFLRSLREFVNE